MPDRPSEQSAAPDRLTGGTEIDSSTDGGKTDASPSPVGTESAGTPAPADEQGGTEALTASVPLAPLPVRNLRDATPHFRRPFSDAAVKWKTQNKMGSGKYLVVPYIDARLVIERLNLVCPDLWQEGVPDRPEIPAYEPIAGGNGLLCRLTVDGKTRYDVGSGYKGKGLYSDAFKRAAVKHGIGVSLYALPQIVFEVSGEYLYTRTNRKGEESAGLTDKGIERCRSGYRAWLNSDAGKLFGEPLDHGDVFGSYGDVVEAEPPTPAEDVPEEPKPLTDEKAVGLIAEAKQLQRRVPAKVLPKAQFTQELASASTSHDALETLVERLKEQAQ